MLIEIISNSLLSHSEFQKKSRIIQVIILAVLIGNMNAYLMDVTQMGQDFKTVIKM